MAELCSASEQQPAAAAPAQPCTWRQVVTAAVGSIDPELASHQKQPGESQENSQLFI